MSTQELSRKESYIPKRSYTKVRKKEYGQLPELQKYIETIIKASNESEDFSDKEKPGRDKKLANKTLGKAGEKRKAASKQESKSSGSRTVSSTVDVITKFEDPRNRSNGSTSLGLGKLLQKIYPNPYQLPDQLESLKRECANVFGEDDSKLAYCKVDAITQVDLPYFDYDIDSSGADIQNISSLTENKTNPKKIPTPQKGSRPKNSDTSSNFSSRKSSLESVYEMRWDSVLKKNYSNSEENCKLNKRNSGNSLSESSTLTENQDYDIGKLTLLNTSGSDASDETLQEEKTDAAEEDQKLNEDTNGEEEKVVEDENKNKDLKDLIQIYDVMNKATESFLLLSTNKSDNSMNKAELKLDLEPNETNQELPDEVINLNEEKEVKEYVASSETPNLNEKVEKGEELVNNSLESSEVLLENDDAEDVKQVGNSDDAENKKNIIEESSKKYENTSGLKFKEKLKSKKLDANQRIDEVLQYMYDCLAKFKSQEKLFQEEEKEERKQMKKTYSEKGIKERLVHVKERKPGSRETLRNRTGESSGRTDSWKNQKPEVDLESKKLIATSFDVEEEGNVLVRRKRCKQKSETWVSNLPRAEKRLGTSSRSSHGISANLASSSRIPCVPVSIHFGMDSTQERNALSVQTVESHNELGGLTEEPVLRPAEASRATKSLLPISAKVRANRSWTLRTIKDVLETEEKLLADEFVLPERKEKNDWRGKKERSDGRLSAGASVTSEHFVVCVSSFPRNIRTATTIRPCIPPPEPLSVSVIDPELHNTKPLMWHIKHSLKKVPISPETTCTALRYDYNKRLEALLSINKTSVAHTARAIATKTIFAKPQEMINFCWDNSKCDLTIHVLEKPLPKLTNPHDACINKPTKNSLCSMSERITDSEQNNFPKNLEKRVVMLNIKEDSVEDLHKSFECLSSCSASEMSKNEAYSETEKVNGKKKIQELLLRTYNLQQKLHQYLHKINSPQQPTLSCPLMPHGPLECSLFHKNDFESSNPEITESSVPLIHWYIRPSERENENKTFKVETLDKSTIYEPPSYETELYTTARNDEHLRLCSSPNDDDDASSIYSFKSSKDISETGDNENADEEKPNNDCFADEFFKKIDSYQNIRESQIAENQENDCEKKNDQLGNALMRHQSKSSSKVLKTVFKGRESSTELTIGLNDVPMTKVSNISVEKTKFSPNHTKISIYISKENTESNHLRKETVERKLSSYYLEQVGPSPNTVRTRYSRLGDNMNSSNDDSDNSDEDFKSVTSSVGDANAIPNEEKRSGAEDRKPRESAPTKNFTKHRFDFYRKMEIESERQEAKEEGVENLSCRYKELEPLKQALTEMQIRMRSIKKDAVLGSHDYYERALKLAKMSAGYCQSCGTRAVIPNDTFGYYKTLLPRRSSHHRRHRCFRTALTPDSSFYSFRSSNTLIGDHFCDLDFKHSSSYSLNHTSHSNRTVLRSSLHDMPVLFENI